MRYRQIDNNILTDIIDPEHTIPALLYSVGFHQWLPIYRADKSGVSYETFSQPTIDDYTPKNWYLVRSTNT